MNKNKSFTLIELLVVIVIIGILAGVIMISTSSSIDKANIAKSKVFEESVENNLAANMVSRWKLDEISGTSIPDAWGDSTGTVGAAPGTPTLLVESFCVNNKCMNFDGDDYISFLDKDALDFGSGNFTFSTWLKSSQYVYLNGLVIHGNGESSSGFYIRQESDSIYTFRIHTGGTTSKATSGTGFSLNKWHYLVAIKDGNVMKVYRDGLIVGSNDHGDQAWNASSASNLLLADTHGRRFLGVIDDVKLFNEALSASQIKQNYIAGLNSMLSNGSISKEELSERINTLAYEQE
jgi:prepilin-type N-terminal cleavage/methylation domain-containing protein